MQQSACLNAGRISGGAGLLSIASDHGVGMLLATVLPAAPRAGATPSPSASAWR